jgi:hypothetical protein
MVKPLQGNIHGPNQRGHLEQFINAKEKYYREILQESFSQSIIENDPPCSLNRDHGPIGC